MTSREELSGLGEYNAWRHTQYTDRRGVRMGGYAKASDKRLHRIAFRKAVSTTEPELTIRAKVTKQVRNLAYINAEIINSCNMARCEVPLRPAVQKKNAETAAMSGNCCIFAAKNRE